MPIAFDLALIWPFSAVTTMFVTWCPTGFPVAELQGGFSDGFVAFKGLATQCRQVVNDVVGEELV